MGSRGNVVAGLALAAFAAWSGWDLHETEARTLVVYATPALRDLLEKDLLPRWRARGGARVLPVYVAAGEQFNRLRMSGSRPEAALFLHASPLFLEKGWSEGHFESFRVPDETPGPTTFASREVDGGRIWRAFAWSPLVEVYASRHAAPPDLATEDLDFGLAHPRLSNNGVYVVAFFESISPQAGRRARARTRVQPVNARATIQGVADGSFDVTLGYEAVAKFFESQGAKVAHAYPVLDGRSWTMPVLFCAALVKGPERPGARELLQFLFAEETRARLGRYHFRAPEGDGLTGPLPGVPGDVRVVRQDWSEWERLEAALPTYEVR